jgi:hypothetical protein
MGFSLGWQGQDWINRAAVLDDELTTTALTERRPAPSKPSCAELPVQTSLSPQTSADQPVPASSSQSTGASPGQRARFVAACGGDEEAGDAMLQRHLDWRAASLPLPADRDVPEWAFTHGRATDGTRILFVLGAKIDLNKGTPAEYALSAAAVVDAIDASLAETERLTVLVDTRGADGWPNPPVWDVIPVARAAAAVLTANYPERVTRIVVYPLPAAATAVWQAFKWVLPTATTSRMVLLAGPAARTSPAPDGLAEYVSCDEIREDLRSRHAALTSCSSDGTGSKEE